MFTIFLPIVVYFFQFYITDVNGFNNYGSNLIQAETVSRPNTSCFSPLYNTTVYGNSFSTFSNVDLNFCCDLCQKISHCVLAQWTLIYWQPQATCQLYSNITNLAYEKSGQSVSLLKKERPFVCNSETNRVFYQIHWTRVNNIDSQDMCIETCALTSGCKSWMFIKDTSYCFTADMFHNGTKWVVYSDTITGRRCTIDFENEI